MSTHNTVGKDQDNPRFIGFVDPDECGHYLDIGSLEYYLYVIEPYFDKFEIYSTEGDYRTPYPFQWWAFSKVLDGNEDRYEAKGGSPLEAIEELFEVIRANAR